MTLKLKLDHHTKNQVSISTYSKVIAQTDTQTQTDRQTNRQTHTHVTKTLPLPHTRQVTRKLIQKYDVVFSHSRKYFFVIASVTKRSEYNLSHINHLALHVYHKESTNCCHSRALHWRLGIVKHQLVLWLHLYHTDILWVMSPCSI